MPSEDRRSGKLLPIPVTPATTVCFRIQIPDAVQYRAAFLGQINVLGQALTWDHPTDGTVCVDCEEAAQLWRNAIYNATWTEECEDPVDCNEVADCIESNPATQAAIAAQIASNPVTQNTTYNTSQYGAPMLPSAYNAPVATSVGCAPNSLFGSVTAIVDQMDRNNRDFLEIIEVGTNTRERVSQLIAAVPAFETLPINEAIDYIDKLQSEVLENYEAQWTDALKDTYRCDLFCIALEAEDCELTFDQIQQYFDARLGAALDPANLFAAMVQYFVAGTWAGSTVVDIMMLTQVSFWRALSNWGGVSLRTLQTVGLLGANDDNPDWGILCDCAEPEGCDGGQFINFRAGSFAFTPFVSRAKYVLGEGWMKGDLPASPTRIAIYRNVLPKPTKMKINYSGLIGEVRVYRSSGGSPIQLLGSQTNGVLQLDGSRTYTIATLATPANDEIMIDAGTSGDLGSIYLRSICWNYT